MNSVRVTSKSPFLPGLFCLIVVLLATSPLYAPAYTIILITSILMYVVMTVSWAIFSGPTGYISLAPAAFFGVGIYTAAILGKEFPVLIVVLLGGIFSVALAAFVGAI